MAPVVAAVATMAAAAVAEMTVTQIIVLGALSLATSVASSLLAPKPNLPGVGSYRAEAQERKQVIRSAVASRKKIYGTANVSGPMVFASSSGDGNKYAHIIIPLAGHEVAEIGDVYFNDRLSTEYDPAYFRIKKHLGSADQAADPDLVAEVAEWTISHRLSGIAYLYVRFQDSTTVWPTGLPNIRATVKGALLYDPRTALTAWSDNGALCIRDYLTDPVLGLGHAVTDIDEPYAIASANICDELVETIDGTQKRYTCNGVVDSANDPASIIDQLRSSIAGYVLPIQGKIRIIAGAYSAPVATLTANELRGPIKIRPRPSRRELFNGVRGVYVSPENKWEMTDFPIVKNATYKEQDGAVEILKDIDLPFTNDPTAAQRIAKIVLEKSRQGIVLEYPCNWSGLNRCVGETVYLDFDGGYGEPSLGWSNKVFRIESWVVSSDGGGVDLVLQEEAAANYAWNMGEATLVDPAPDTSLASPADIAPPGTPQVSEELYETRTGTGVKAKAIISWAPSIGPYLRSYQPEYKLAADTDYKPLLAVSSEITTLEILDITPGKYNFRVRAANSLGVVSTWAETVAEVYGLLYVPADVSGLTLSALSSLAILQWNRHPDLDVRIGGRIRFRHSTKTDGSANWQNSTDIGTAIDGGSTVAVLPLKEGTYLAKAVDSSGLFSTTATPVVTLAPNLLSFANVAYLPEHPTWSGTHTNTIAIDGVLKLVGVGLADDIPDLDGLPDVDSFGGIVPFGTYDFGGGIDLGTKKRVRLRSHIVSLSVNVLDLVDSRTDPIDEWEDIDGTVNAATNAEVWYRTTDDDPSATPTWSDWQLLVITDIYARGIDFQARLYSDDPAYNIHVSELATYADEVI